VRRENFYSTITQKANKNVFARAQKRFFFYFSTKIRKVPSEKNRTTRAKAEYSLLREEEEDKSEESNEHLVVRFFER